MKFMRVIKCILLSGLILLLLAGCSASPATTPAPTSPAATAADMIPTEPAPKMSADTGAVKMSLVSSYTKQPLSDALIRLVTMLKVKGSLDNVYVPALDSQNNPWGNTDASGNLVVSNVKPGKYSLAYIFPIGMPQLITVGGPDKNYSFDVEAGKLLDLGTLTVDVDPNKIR